MNNIKSEETQNGVIKIAETQNSKIEKAEFEFFKRIITKNTTTINMFSDTLFGINGSRELENVVYIKDELFMGLIKGTDTEISFSWDQVLTFELDDKNYDLVFKIV